MAMVGTLLHHCRAQEAGCNGPRGPGVRLGAGQGYGLVEPRPKYLEAKLDRRYLASSVQLIPELRVQLQYTKPEVSFFIALTVNVKKPARARPRGTSYNHLNG